MKSLVSIVVAMTFLLSLVACNQQPGTPASDQAAAPEPGGQATGFKVRQIKKPLPHNVKLPMAYQLRMDKQDVDAKTATARRRTSLEFLQGDAASVNKQLSEALTAAGFKMGSTSKNGDDIRTQYAHKDGTRVSIVVRPHPKGLKLSSPDAKGVVSMKWTLAH